MMDTALLRRMWWIKVPFKASFFAWSAALNKILTTNNHKKRHVIVVDRCCMCKKNGESVDNLHLHCDVAYAIWIAFFGRFGLFWVMPRCVVKFVCLLVDFRQSTECCCVEDDAYVPFMVFMERNE